MNTITVTLLSALVALVTGAPRINIDSKVINGEDAAQGEIPYIVSLRKQHGHFCGGSIINERWILTAAHCIKGVSPTIITVVSGTTLQSSGGNKTKVLNVIVHEEYNPGSTWRNDIGLLELETSLSFNTNVAPVNLPQQDQIHGAGTDVLVSGWGYTSYGNWELPDHLQKLKLKLISNDDCQTQHSGTIYPTSVCASAGKDKGVCNGDSGGPLVSSAGGEIIGIVSWGRPCATGVADVYTRVPKYVDWINQHIQSRK